MAEFPALPLWTDAYLGDTRHLSTLEHGAYLLLLMTAWRTRETSLPDDDKLLARYAGLGPRQWAQVRPVLEPFYRVENGRWIQLRLIDERKRLEDRRKVAAANGRASALKRQGRHSAERGDLFTPSDSKASTPTATTTTTVKEEGAKAPSKKGTRLPSDWQPTKPLPDAVRALVEQWPDGRVERELEQFVDYWTSRSKDATKLDWDRAWWNRIRDQHDRIMREANFAANRNSSAPGAGQRQNGFRDALREMSGRSPRAGSPDDDRGGEGPPRMGFDFADR